MNSSCVSLPRRHVIGCGIASMAFGGSALAQGTDVFPPLPAKISVTSNHLTTPVMVDGKGPFHFVVDTGADRSVLAKEVAEALHLPVGSDVIVQGIVRALPTQSVEVRELSFGNVVREDLRMPVISRNMLQADGYLGIDAIGAHRVVFDFRRGILEVVESIPASFIEKGGANESRIPAPGYSGHLRAARCLVDGVPTVAFIDSGAEVSAGNQVLHAALKGRDRGYAGERDIELSGITGGSSIGKVVHVRTIELGDLEFSGCQIAMADLNVFRVWELADKPALLIGLNFLRQFQRVSVDYRRKEFRLKLASAGWVTRRPT